MRLNGCRVRASALMGAGNDACIGAERIEFAKLVRFAEFSSDAGGENEANAWNTGK